MVAAFTWKLNCRRPVTGSVSSTRPELHKEETIPLDRSHTARTKTQFRQHQNHLAFRTPIHHLADLRTSQAVLCLTAPLAATEYPLQPRKLLIAMKTAALTASTILADCGSFRRPGLTAGYYDAFFSLSLEQKDGPAWPSRAK